jgi:cytochrome c peroxidase
LYYNNGKDSVFTDPGDHYSVSGDITDQGAYKAPTLRNIALTGPYMHDGRFKTLDEVIDFYSEGVILAPYTDPLMHHAITGGVRLTAAEKTDLKAFILSLQDDEFLSDPRFSAPQRFPDDL